MTDQFARGSARAALAIPMLLSALAGFSDHARAAKGSLECGSIVIADLTLDGDLGPCPGDGLAVVSNGVNINLNGFRIHATRRQNVGIRLENVSNVVVKGGVVEGFDSGVLLTGGSNNQVTAITARNNRTGIRVENAPSGAHVVEKNSVVDNRLFGVLSTGAAQLRIAKNAVRHNLGNGIVLNGGSSFGSIDRNEATGNKHSDIELSAAEVWVAYRNLIPPLFTVIGAGSSAYIDGVDFHIGGLVNDLLDLSARVVPVGVVLGAGATAFDNPLPADSSSSGCTTADYAAAGLLPGDVALIQRGTCQIATKVQMALNAGARAVILFNEGQSPDRTTHDFGFYADFPAGLGLLPAAVVFASYRVGFELLESSRSASAFVRIRARNDYTVVAGPGKAHHNLVTKNIADRAVDENSFCDSLTNEWTKNQFTLTNRPCVAGDLSGDSGPSGTGSRARIY